MAGPMSKVARPSEGLQGRKVEEASRGDAVGLLEGRLS